MFWKVLNETSHLCNLFESNSALIYQLPDAVKDVMENLIDIKNDDASGLLSQNIKLIKEPIDNANFLKTLLILL